MKIVIAGAKKSSHSPIEVSNSLRSHAFASLLDLISEGEIEGLVDGAKSVYFDEVPLQNADGTYNFDAVELDTREGTQDQAYMKGFATVEHQITVGAEFKNSNPIIRSITNPDVNAARIQVYLPALVVTDTSTGDINGSQVTLAIDVQSDGGGYVQVVRDTIRGKSNSRYDRTYRVPLTGTAPFDIRVRRITADNHASNYQDKIYWDSYTEIIDAKLRYPNSALVGVKIDATQFQSIPQRAYDVKGIKVQVPSNYDPDTRIYTGIWDGTFQTLWSDNPAWVFYDLLTNSRYGLGNYIAEDQVDKWALYTIAQYCDELVDNGDGGTEPRFTCNVYMQARAEAYKVLQDLASAFRGMVYWAEGLVTVVQDAPGDEADYIYNQSNVVDGSFSYSGAAAKSRHSVALVTWNDPDDFYRQKIEYVEDQAAIAEFGVIETEVTAFGCTSRGQAHRVGKWLLYTEQNESEIVTFKVGIEGATARPGQVIKIADAMRAGTRLGGRISSATTTTVTIDDDISFSLSDAEIYVLLPTGLINRRTISSVAGRVVTVGSAFDSAPNSQGTWLIKTLDVAPQTFRVLGAVEQQDGIFQIAAIKYNESKFDFVENGIALEERSITNLTASPSAPSGLKLTESLYQSSGEVKTKLSISWDRLNAPVSYLIEYRRGDGNPTKLPEQSSNDIELLDAQPGVYEINVTALNTIGDRSLPASITQTVFGKTSLPGDVADFRLSPLGQNAFLTWTKSEDLDVIIGGFVRIRYTSEIATPSWNNAVDLISDVPGASVSVVAPLLTGTYLAKFIDSSGNFSANATIIETTAPDINNFNAVEVLTEDPTFTGDKDGLAVDSILSALVLSGAGMLDDVDDFDDIDDFNFFEGLVNSEGTYLFANDIDLGAVYPSHLVALLNFITFTQGTDIDAITDDVDDWTDLDGDTTDDASATLYFRETDDDPAGTPTWSDWKPFLVIDTQARAFQFKVVLRSLSSTSNIAVSGLAVSIDMADRIEHQNGLVSGTGPSALHVTFAAPFKAAPGVVVTAFDLATKDYWVISNKTATGFDIVFKNEAGTVVSRTFDMIAKGYGKLVA